VLLELSITGLADEELTVPVHLRILTELLEDSFESV